MTVKVYIWLPHGGKVGHASMVLSNGVYISFWPAQDMVDKLKGASKYKAKCADEKSSTSENLQEDVDAEEANPNETLIISVHLDERKMEEFWAKVTGTSQYALFMNNCSTIVYQALIAGGAPKISEPYVWIPAKLADYVRDKLVR